MANALYDNGRESFLIGNLSWTGDDIRVILIDEADETVNLVTDEDLVDVTGAGIVATSGALGSKTATNGNADCGDFTLSTVTGDPSESLTFYNHTGVNSTSLLICNIDTATGLPVTPNGSDINVVINVSGVFFL